MRILRRYLQYVIEHGTVKGGPHVLRRNDRGAGLSGSINAAVDKQLLGQLTDTEGKVDRSDIHEGPIACDG
jgi:hypothetical protein